MAEVGDAYADDGQQRGAGISNPMIPAEDEVPTPLPPGWTEKYSRSQQSPYWVSQVDGQSTWVRPTEAPPGINY